MKLRNMLSLAAIALGSFAASAQLAWADKNRHFYSNESIDQWPTDTVISGWRGEKVNALALFSPKTDGVVTAKISGPISGEARFIDYVTTNGFRGCGRPQKEYEPYEVPDIISDPAAQVVAGQSRPVWVSLNVADDIAPGTYVDSLTIDGESIPITIKVNRRAIPAPADRKFYLNLWQQPYAISRYYGVEPWSDAHFELLKPYAKMLADASQRTISAILFFEPWGEQSNDLFLPMVETFRNADGTWEYDYTVFDRWVEFMTEQGVGPDIECYSMIPWEMSFRYFGRAKNDYEVLKTTTDSPEYRELWSNFLSAFAAHVTEKGWFDRTMIAMDERSMADMKNAIEIIDEAAPGMKISLAGNYHPEIADRLYALTITQGDQFPPGEVARRRARGQISSLYTCCSSPEPNIFSNSAPADAAWLPLHSTITGHDGYLHWSWSNWTDDPLHDSRFKLFAPGDTYFIYPDAKSSVRFERLIEGIQLSEKVRLLRLEFIADNNAEALTELNDALMIVSHTRPRPNASTGRQIDSINAIIARYE